MGLSVITKLSITSTNGVAVRDYKLRQRFNTLGNRVKEKMEESVKIKIKKLLNVNIYIFMSLIPWPPDQQNKKTISYMQIDMGIKFKKKDAEK